MQTVMCIIQMNMLESLDWTPSEVIMAWKQAMAICGHRLSLQARRVRLLEVRAHTNLLLDQFVGC